VASPFRSMRAGNRDVQMAHEAIRQHIASVEHDAELCATIIAGGEFHYRLTFWHAFKGFRYVTPQEAEPCWEYFKNCFDRHWPGWRGSDEEYQPAAARVLDALEVPSEPTESDIANAWEVESASSEEGRRFLYGPGGSPQQLLEQLKRMH
jgi:hypothetical protein